MWLASFGGIALFKFKWGPVIRELLKFVDLDCLSIPPLQRRCMIGLIIIRVEDKKFGLSQRGS